MSLLRKARLLLGITPVSTAPAVTATDTDRAMMGRALELAAHAATLGEVPVGAVVYETATGRVVGEGYNRREMDHDPSAHAEHIAMVQAAKARGDWRLTGCTLVVTLEPCAMCAGLIVNARPERVVFGALDPKAGAVASLYQLLENPRLNHRVRAIAGVEADASGRLLRAFFKRLRRERGQK